MASYETSKVTLKPPTFVPALGRDGLILITETVCHGYLLGVFGDLASEPLFLFGVSPPREPNKIRYHLPPSLATRGRAAELGQSDAPSPGSASRASEARNQDGRILSGDGADKAATPVPVVEAAAGEAQRLLRVTGPLLLKSARLFLLLSSRSIPWSISPDMGGNAA